MFVRFISQWMGNEPGSTADMEGSLANRLISLGVAELPPVGVVLAKDDKEESEEVDAETAFASPPKRRPGRPRKVRAETSGDNS